MAILPFPSQTPARRAADILTGFSIEVMPRTAAKVDSFVDILPQGTRIYIAHVEGTPIDDMVATARRLRAEGFPVMPHVPARRITDETELRLWLRRYREDADVDEALVLAGDSRQPAGVFDSSMQLLETGYFEDEGFAQLHVAGHPEGNGDIDPDGGTRAVDAALLRKSDYARDSSAEMAVVTQFAFDADRVLDWADRLEWLGVTLPIHVGVAGPAKLQTLIKFSVACGVGPSLSVLKKRAKDLTKLVRRFEPTGVLSGLAAGRATGRGNLIAGVHLFPLGGIRVSADYAGGLSEAESKQAAGRRL